MYVCMCEEMFVSRMNYNISLFLFFIYREVSGFHQNPRQQYYFSGGSKLLFFW